MASIIIDGHTIQMPSAHSWAPPGSLGVSGVGDDVLPAIWSYALGWDYMLPPDFNVLWTIRLTKQGQNISASLPEIGAVGYTFKTYTCRINPVIHQGFFEGAYQGVRTMLVGIDITIP